MWKTQLKLSRSGVSTLGSKYWRNFKKRHDNILDSGSGETQYSTAAMGVMIPVLDLVRSICALTQDRIVSFSL